MEDIAEHGLGAAYRLQYLLYRLRRVCP